MEPVIALFDLDGVLVHPGGYRTAFHQTIRHILQKIHLDYLLPSAKLIELFEANSVNSEWDMIPITLALILEAVYLNNPQLQIPSKLDDALREIQAAQLLQAQIDYPKAIDAISHTFKLAETPSLGLLRGVETGQTKEPYSEWKTFQLLKDLLITSRDLKLSYPVRLFQNYVLGSQRFKEVYDFPVLVDSESMMSQHDSTLITPDARDCIADCYRSGALHLAALTFRPSLPPREVQVEDEGYSPEAELALSRLELDFIPLIGYGRISYLAQQIGTTPDKLIKPSPVQALAGIAAAWTRDEWRALNWAYAISHNSTQPDSSFLPSRFQFHIFEDTPIGIVSSRKAIEILEKAGFQVDLHAWGISSHAGKASSLEAVGVPVYKDVNEAISKFKGLFPKK